MYETRIGKFKGAVDPCTASFREFPSWANEKFQSDMSRAQKPDGEDDRLVEPPKSPRIAMYCTGGIRCEKASSFLLSKGFEEVESSVHVYIFPLSSDKISQHQFIVTLFSIFR